MKPQLLQTYELLPDLEAELSSRFLVHRLFEIKDTESFLKANGAAIKAVVTGGHIGLPSDIAEHLTNLEIVAINGVGFDKVDLQRAREHGYGVCTTPDVLSDDVADLTIGLMIAAQRQFRKSDRHISSGLWPQGELPLGHKASGCRYGIFGMGRIGKRIARRLEAFDGEIAYCSRKKQDNNYRYHADITTLAEWADVLIVAAAATPETRSIVDGAVLSALGSDGVLINVARGSLVDEHALILALSEGRVRAAGLDVFEQEPRVPRELIALDNVVVLPHIGAATYETRRAMGSIVLANLDAHLDGRPLITAIV